MKRPAAVVLVTAPSMIVARRIAQVVVKERLAACANLVPGLRSIYRWQGKIADEPEVLVIFKTTAASFEALSARVVELHPYDVPEVVRLDISAGHGPYLTWLAESVTRPARRAARRVGRS